jgi:transposase
MGESAALIRFLGGAMPKPYSYELRVRVIELIEAGATRREAAELFGVSPSVAVIWAQRFEATGSVSAKPSGGSISPLEKHADFLRKLIAAQPDLTLDEVVAAMQKARIAGSRTAVWRFYERHGLSFKKNFVRGRAKARRGGSRPPPLDARARLLRPGETGVYR